MGDKGKGVPATEAELRESLRLALRALMHAEKLSLMHQQSWSLVHEARVTAAATLDTGRDGRDVT